MKVSAVLSLSGPWTYYRHFEWVHQLKNLPAAKAPEIAVKSGSVVSVPVHVLAMQQLDGGKITIRVQTPSGWKPISDHSIAIGKGLSADLPVDIETPVLTKEELKNAQPQEVVVRGEVDGQSIGEAKLRVLLKVSALPQ
jgi:hypothetical protein